jgi:putative photosynthetic complex assembly protein
MSMHDLAKQPVVPRGVGLPKWLQHALAALLLFSIAAATFGKVTDIGTVRVERAEPIAIRDIAFVERAGDVLDIVDPRDGGRVLTVQPGQEGFIRGVLRGMTRLRQTRGADPAAPYRLVAWADGRVTLTDTLSGEVVTLNAFGGDNLRSFARFLEGHGAR